MTFEIFMKFHIFKTEIKEKKSFTLHKTLQRANNSTIKKKRFVEKGTK